MTSTTAGMIGLRLAHPALSGLVGLFVWAAATAFAHPDLAEPGEEGLTLGNWVTLVMIALFGYLIACAIGTWGWSGSSRRCAAVAVSLSVASLVVVIAPWSGWPNIFGATALGLAAERRRRAGRLTPGSLLAGVLGAGAFTAATVWSAFFP
ncbi:MULTISPECIES: hypothetical protein [unclassified Nocardioides]|uniref:hypothetical protein n=1 Tax=unclassified Nocardioides TaxID=2615069 RepID=UPI00360694DE